MQDPNLQGDLQGGSPVVQGAVAMSIPVNVVPTVDLPVAPAAVSEKFKRAKAMDASWDKARGSLAEGFVLSVSKLTVESEAPSASSSVDATVFPMIVDVPPPRYKICQGPQGSQCARAEAACSGHANSENPLTAPVIYCRDCCRSLCPACDDVVHCRPGCVCHDREAILPSGKLALATLQTVCVDLDNPAIFTILSRRTLPTVHMVACPNNDCRGLTGT